MRGLPHIPSLPRYLPTEFYDSVRAYAETMGIRVCDDVIVEGQPLLEVLGAICHAGGTVHRVGGWVECFPELCLFTGAHQERLDAAGPEYTVAVYPSGARLLLQHGTGLFRVELGAETYIVAGAILPTLQVRRSAWEAVQVVALFGCDMATVTTLSRAIHSPYVRPLLRGWGGAKRELDVPPVQETDVVLQYAQKTELLEWLDRFWVLRDRAREFGLAIHRGLLLVGPPGTGKTQIVRHILTRYPSAEAHLFVASRHLPNDEEFQRMIAAAAGARDGAILVLEDIDQLLRSGAVTREFLLNVLDGLLALEVPALWIATSNDPTELDPAILERPGRFDRVITIGMPDIEERLELLRRLCSRLRLSEATLKRASEDSEGLTGAHLKEAAAATMLRWIETPEVDCDDALLAEVTVLHRQHMNARSLKLNRISGRPAGFSTD